MRRVRHASARMLTDAAFSEAWSDVGLRPTVFGCVEEEVEGDKACVVRSSRTVLRVLLDKIPLSKESCPKSKTEESMAAMFAGIGRLDVPSFPYPVDFRTRFFIPASAIVCTLEDNSSLECEGMVDIDRKTIRVDAVDQKDYAWFYASVQFE